MKKAGKTKKKVVLFGAGGHAKVILDIVEKQGLYSIAALVDPSAKEKTLLGYPVLKAIPPKVQMGIVAMGDNLKRAQIVESVSRENSRFQFISAIHPSAVIGKEVEIGEGSVVMAGACINPGSAVGAHCIVNTRASIDHDCTLGDFVSIGPGACLGGAVKVGEMTAIGLGTSCIQLIEIGKKSLVGAGSVVVENVHDLVVAYGNPCRERRTRKSDEPFYENRR